jgi:hypothetical protein
MNLANLAIEPKHRSDWSAIDLGFLLARENYFKLLLAWLLPSLPVFLMLLLLPKNYLFWAALIIWWLKPFWDRLPLAVAGKVLFGEPVDFADLKKELFSVLKPSILPWLTYRRFSPERSYILPVLILEQLSGKAFSKRVTNLHYGVGGGPSWLTVICVHFEMILVFGFYAFLLLLIPAEVEIDYWQMIDQQEAYAIYLNSIATFIGMALIAPFYVCAGFMLYINQRIYLEGWDIELRFRTLAEKVKKDKAKRFGASALSVFLLCAVLTLQAVMPEQAMAENTAFEKVTASISENFAKPVVEETVSVTTSEQAKALISEIKAGEDFANKKTVTRYRLVNAKEEVDEEGDGEKSWWIKFIEWMFDGGFGASGASEDTVSLIAMVVEVMLWALAIMLLAYVLSLSVKWLQQLNPRFAINREHTVPDVMFGLDLTEELSVKEVAIKAQQFLSDKHYREALAVVYAALLQRLIKDYHFELKEGFTEKECETLVLSSTQEGHAALKPFVSFITKHWLTLAYAHQPIADDVGEKVISDWLGLFDAS